jgi:hypothetical protein
MNGNALRDGLIESAAPAFMITTKESEVARTQDAVSE